MLDFPGQQIGNVVNPSRETHVILSVATHVIPSVAEESQSPSQGDRRGGSITHAGRQTLKAGAGAMLITKLQHCPNAEVIIVDGMSSKGRLISMVCQGCYEVLAREIWKH